MHQSIQKLCSALDMLQLQEQAFALGEAVDIADFHRRQQAVMIAAKAARPALECLKAGVETKRLTIVADLRTVARGDHHRAVLQEVGA